VTSESRAWIVPAIHEAAAFRLHDDSTRFKDRAHALTIEVGDQSFLMQLGFDTDVFEQVGLSSLAKLHP